MDTPEHFTYRMGDLVKKKRNSQWRGEVCGFYSTEATPEGYDVNSHFEIGSVQCWPRDALEAWDGVKPTDWRTMESAPRDETQILAEVKDGYYAVISFWGSMWRESANGLGLANDPIRWKPIT